MTEEQANTEISMGTTQNAESQKAQPQPVLKNYSVPMVLVLIGFYFLVFAIIELVTNFYEHTYLFQFPCADFQCSANLSAVSFPNQGNIYIYLSNSKLTQNILQGFTRDHTLQLLSCEFYGTNAETGKTVSVSGLALGQNQKSFPCGRIPMLYPQNQFIVTDVDLNRNITVKADGISSTNFYYKNANINMQWADVEASRYSIWIQNSIALGINKYWGYISDPIPKNMQIKLKSKNKLQTQLKEGLKIQFTDNMALGGNNLPLCVFNFIWAVATFLFGCLSFWVISKNKSISNNMGTFQGQTEEQQNQCQVRVNSTPTAHC